MAKKVLKIKLTILQITLNQLNISILQTSTMELALVEVFVAPAAIHRLGFIQLMVALYLQS